MDANTDPLIGRFIELCGGTQPKAAERIGVVQQTVSKLLRREIGCTAEIAISIHRATGGKVSASALRPDLWRRPKDVPMVAPPLAPDAPKTRATA